MKLKYIYIIMNQYIEKIMGEELSSYMRRVEEERGVEELGGAEARRDGEEGRRRRRRQQWRI